MKHCSFCGEANIVLRAGRLRLCPSCRDRLVRLKPEDLSYGWYLRAVRRALKL